MGLISEILRVSNFLLNYFFIYKSLSSSWSSGISRDIQQSTVPAVKFLGKKNPLMSQNESDTMIKYVRWK